MKLFTELDSENINEDLLLETIIGFLGNHKLSLDLVKHAEDRQSRNNKDFIAKFEIAKSICKVAKQIRDDFDTNITSIGDRIKVEDKSRKDKMNIICDLENDTKNNGWLKVTIITHMKGEMPAHDIKKTYSTYVNDNDLSKGSLSMIKGLMI